MSLILDQKNYMLEVLAVLSLGLLAKCHLADVETNHRKEEEKYKAYESQAE
jgi:hypothetical protein